MNFQTAMSMLQSHQQRGRRSLCTLSSGRRSANHAVLDAGAYGVICPHVDSPDLARRFVEACRYPPVARASSDGGADYFDHAKTHVLTLAMIESREALDALDAILDTPGLAGIYVGPNDLALSLGARPGVHSWASVQGSPAGHLGIKLMRCDLGPAGWGIKLGPVYAASPRCAHYSTELRKPGGF